MTAAAGKATSSRLVRRNVARRLTAHVVVTIARVAGVKVALRVAATAGRLGHLLTGGPSARDVAAVFAPCLPASTHRQLARRISALMSRNRALSAIVERAGLDAAVRLVNSSGVASLGAYRDSGAAIFVTWHFGPPFGLTAAFEHLRMPLLGVVRRADYPRARDGEIAFTTGGPDAATDALWRAVRHLRRGGQVALAADGRAGAHLPPFELLGRQVSLARGPFVLARLSGAPLVPALPRWDDDGCISVEIGPPIRGDRALINDAPAFEQHCAAEAISWLDTRFRAYPDQVRFGTVAAAFAAPPATPFSRVR